MSDSVRPHRLQPIRLPRPWDSPGNNTRVGCHFLLQCMKVKSESEVAQSCPTPSDPMDCSLPGSSAHGIFQARVLEWGAIAFSSELEYILPYLPKDITPGAVSNSALYHYFVFLICLITPTSTKFSITPYLKKKKKKGTAIEIVKGFVVVKDLE